MPQIRISLAQVNPTVGDIAGNSLLVRNWCAKAAESAAHIVAFPEMMLTGYPIEDLALRESFQEASVKAVSQLALDLVADGLGDLIVVVGHLSTHKAQIDQLGKPKGSPANTLSGLHPGQVIVEYSKHHLPNYGVFDEYRNFVAGDKSAVIRVGGVDIALAICEDLWQEGGPVARVAKQNVGLLLVINGSPYEVNKDDARLELVSRRAKEANASLAYVNMVGGQDELVFDGDSIVVNENGQLLGRAPLFEEGLLTLDLDLKAADTNKVLSDGTEVAVISEWPFKPYTPLKPNVAPAISDIQTQYAAVVVGLRDYVKKNGFKSVILGLSGGIDSALVAAIAADAIGAQNVFGVSLPSKYSSDHSKSDALDLANRLGINFRTIAIEGFVSAYESALELTGLASENLQARVRGVTLMALSNQEGHLVLATGNKSELAVGYSTIYGDAVGGFAPIKDVPKTIVWEMAKWRNRLAITQNKVAPIPDNSITKEPSAELRPGQKDSDSLPDYILLDKLLDAYVEQDLGSRELIELGFDPALVDRVLKMVDRAEYKRRQYPPGTKISKRAFGRDRRLPITSAWDEQH
jgi:NAD+ synthase (glutamine-hydrolysing)